MPIDRNDPEFSSPIQWNPFHCTSLAWQIIRQQGRDHRCKQGFDPGIHASTYTGNQTFIDENRRAEKATFPGDHEMTTGETPKNTRALSSIL